MASTNSCNSTATNKLDLRVRMKDSVELYRAQNSQVHIDNVLILERYKSQIKWKPSGGRIIDLGCGDGGMTRTLEKYLPPNYEVLVGCDLNQNMLQFAKENYATDRIKFSELDIEGEIPNDWKEGFDHVFSFHALHWVRNQEKAFGNIFDLLAEGGDCLLLFMARHPIYDMFLALSTTDKWSSYLKNVDNFLSPYYDCQEPDKKVCDMMEEIGFSHVDVRCKQMLAVYSSLEPLKHFAMAINPFDVPNDLTEQFMADIEEVLRGLRLVHRNEDGRETTKCSYNLLAVYATK